GPTEKALASLAGGAQFLGAWQCFMQRHGHHTRAEIELMNRRWRETPDQVLNMVRSYLTTFDSMDPLALHRQRRNERRQLKKELAAGLGNPLKRWLFEFLLESGQRGCLVRENIKSEAVRRLAHGRSVFLELGRRWLERGILDDPED